jgi:hypothetical protein
MRSRTMIYLGSMTQSVKTFSIVVGCSACRGWIEESSQILHANSPASGLTRVAVRLPGSPVHLFSK